MESAPIKRRRSDGSKLRLIVLIFFVATSFYFLYLSYPKPRLKGTKIAMTLTSLEATVSSFTDVFGKFRSQAPQHKLNLILFLADRNPATNLSWCPDCVRAEPVIYKKVEAASDDVALLTVYVGDRPTWRNPQHPFRVDDKFKLTGVPTLIRWENDQVKGRLGDREAHLEHKLDALMANK